MRRESAIRLACAVGCLLALLAAAASASARPIKCNGEQRLCNRRFDRVVIPATHNSMSAQSLGFSLPNQPVGIPDQLRAGIRGLLFDTYYAHKSGNTVVNDPTPTAQSSVYLCHVACQIGATPLIDVLRYMRRFLHAHPHNVIVVDNEDYVAPADFAKVVRQSGLARYVYRGRPGPRWPTLRTMIRRHQQVVLLAEHQAGSVPWYHVAYQGILQETPYDWATPNLLTDPSQWEASCRPNRGGTTGSLFLMNHWSPPAAPSPATSAVVNAADTIVGRARTCRRVRGLLPTIVAVDMFKSGGLFDAVRRLNAGGG